MISIGAMKKILERKGVYLAESLEELRVMVTAKFPGLSDGEVNEVIEKNRAAEFAVGSMP